MATAINRVIAGLALFIGVAIPAVAETPALPEPCERVSLEGTDFITCTVDPEIHNIRLFHDGPDGRPYGSLEAFVARGPEVLFAMNAGMYLPDLAPQGLYVENGKTLAPLATGDGDGNFYLKPNGVFMVTVDGHATVIETGAFEVAPQPFYATQSGPMLVIGGSLHPAFAEDGTSRFVRNGVGVRSDGKVVFAISLTEVSFGRFARLFRDTLACPNALYLDGFVSGLVGEAGMVAGGDYAAGSIIAVLNR